MKVGQLTECNMRNIHLEESYDVVKELVPEPFLKN